MFFIKQETLMIGFVINFLKNVIWDVFLKTGTKLPLKLFWEFYQTSLIFFEFLKIIFKSYFIKLFLKTRKWKNNQTHSKRLFENIF